MLSKIESKIHPLLKKNRNEFIDKNKKHPIITFDIPLLFETGERGWLDGVLVVTTNPIEQERRVLKRGTMTKEQFQQINSKQINIMGASKRLAELCVQGLYDQNKFDNFNFSIVRFGNVIESSGSVIPKFKQLSGRHICNNDGHTIFKLEYELKCMNEHAIHEVDTFTKTTPLEIYYKSIELLDKTKPELGPGPPQSCSSIW